MKPNLDALKDNILEHLQTEGFVVFHGFCHNAASRPIAYWDSSAHPDFTAFLSTARQAGIKLVVFNYLEFSSAMVDDAMERLEEYELPLEERRGFERRLREMQAYQGFTCALELSFDSEGRTFVYELRADWYVDFLHILDQVESYAPEGAEDEEEGEEDSIGGYFSRN
jgi:hypothetical protein